MIRLLMLLSALSLVAGETYRINTNGPAFVDGNGNAWSPDAFFQGTGLTYASSGNSIDTSGPGVTSELLYRTERYRADTYYKFPGKFWCETFFVRFMSSFSPLNPFSSQLQTETIY
jgi:hypothetical protein